MRTMGPFDCYSDDDHLGWFLAGLRARYLDTMSGVKPAMSMGDCCPGYSDLPTSMDVRVKAVSTSGVQKG